MKSNILRTVIAVILFASVALLAQDKLPSDPGMYYRSGVNYVPMNRACNAGMKAMGFGVRGKFVYNNPSAPAQISEHRPLFVFIGADQHPNVRQQFSLVAMTAKKKNREVEFAAGGVMKNQLEVKVTEEMPNIRIVPAADLPSGEYLLGMFQGASDATIATLLGCGYDFSVR
ncbi:MAG: hypothetical protein WCF68_13300 [Terriglobales bacterium]